MVSRDHARVRSPSAHPPQRSTTCRPSTYAETAAPSSPFANPRLNESATASKPGSTVPCTPVSVTVPRLPRCDPSATFEVPHDDGGHRPSRPHRIRDEVHERPRPVRPLADLDRRRHGRRLPGRVVVGPSARRLLAPPDLEPRGKGGSEEVTDRVPIRRY